MKHSSTYPFRRWYRRPLTPRESSVIGLLERRRRRTGRVSIVLTVSAAEHAAISRLLLRYALFLNNRCPLSCVIHVATTHNSTLITPHSGQCPPHCAAHRRAHTPRAGPNSSLLTPHSSLLTARSAQRILSFHLY